MVDRSSHNVVAQSKSVYVEHSNKGVVKGSVDPNAAYVKNKNPNVELYAERWEKGLDIWTGKALTGAGLADWKGQKRIHKRFSNRDNTKRKRVARAIKKVGSVRMDVRAYCEEHFQFSPSSNLIAEIITEISRNAQK